jgi:phosphoglycolate phosphatase
MRSILPSELTAHTQIAWKQRPTLFCDFDGPLVDVSDRYYATYQQALAAVADRRGDDYRSSISALTKSGFWEMKCERVPDAEIALRSGLREAELDMFRCEVDKIVNHPSLLGKDRLQLGVSWALSMLHDRGVRLVVVTLRPQTQAVQILRNYGLTRLFEGIYGTTDDLAAYQNYASVKTDLLATAIAEQLRHEERSLAWIVGDTEADIIAGRSAKIQTIAVKCGIRSHRLLKKYDPHHIVPDLMAAAHTVVAATAVCA